MIAVDTQILVYAHRRDSPWHEPAAACLRSLAEGTEAWALPWPCVHEFLAVVTHERMYSPPTSMDEALAQVDAWLASPSALLLTEGEDHARLLHSLLGRSRVTGPRVHDARVAALCIGAQVKELWTADRDFSRFGPLMVVNPLVRGN